MAGAARGRMGTVVRQLVRTPREGALATLSSDDDQAGQGAPYVSFVTVAADLDGSPILLLSGLADHTKNLDRNARCSLLLEERSGNPANPQTGARVSLTGQLARTDDKDAARRFLARHPGARLYAGFGDFSFYRMQVDRARYVGGFGSAVSLERDKFILGPKAIRAFEKEQWALLDRLNKEQSALIRKLCRQRISRRGKHWQAMLVDADGLDVVCGKRQARLCFDRPAKDASDVLVSLQNML